MPNALFGLKMSIIEEVGVKSLGAGENEEKTN